MRPCSRSPRPKLNARRNYCSVLGDLNTTQRKSALAALTSHRLGASATVQAVKSGVIAKEELDAATLDKLRALLGDDKDLAALLQEMGSLLQPVVRFDGKGDTYVWTKYKLAGPSPWSAG